MSSWQSLLSCRWYILNGSWLESVLFSAKMPFRHDILAFVMMDFERHQRLETPPGLTLMMWVWDSCGKRSKRTCMSQSMQERQVSLHLWSTALKFLGKNSSSSRTDGNGTVYAERGVKLRVRDFEGNYLTIRAKSKRWQKGHHRHDHRWEGYLVMRLLSVILFTFRDCAFSSVWKSVTSSWTVSWRTRAE